MKKSLVVTVATLFVVTVAARLNSNTLESAEAATLSPIEIDSKIGFADDQGNIIIEPQWDSVQNFSEGLWLVSVGHQWVFVDKIGNIISDPQLDAVSWFNEGLAAVSLDGKWGFIDTSGNIVIDPQWDWSTGFSYGIARVGRDNEQLFIDTNGNVIDNPQLRDTFAFHDTLWGSSEIVNRSL